MTLIPGQIITCKFRGVKTKFSVLGLDDIISEDCVYANIAPPSVLYLHPVYDRKEIERLYRYALDANVDDYRFYETQAVGDKVVEHYTRLYLKKIN